MNNGNNYKVSDILPNNFAQEQNTYMKMFSYFCVKLWVISNMCTSIHSYFGYHQITQRSRYNNKPAYISSATKYTSRI